MFLILTILAVFFSTIISFPMVSPRWSSPSTPLPPPTPRLALIPHLDDLIDPTLSCSSDWQCPYRWYCVQHTCTKDSQLDEDRLAGSAFALAVQSLLVFGSIALFLCSPCLSLIFFGYYLGYCPTGAVDRSKSGKESGGDKEKEEVVQEMMVVKKKGVRELLTRSGKSKKKKALKISEAQAQVLAQVNQLTPSSPPPPQVIASSAALEQQSKMVENGTSSSLQNEPTGTLAQKADDDIAAAEAAKME